MSWAQSKELYNNIRDVSTTVDMTLTWKFISLSYIFCKITYKRTHAFGSSWFLFPFQQDFHFYFCRWILVLLSWVCKLKIRWWHDKRWNTQGSAGKGRQIAGSLRLMLLVRGYRANTSVRPYSPFSIFQHYIEKSPSAGRYPTDGDNIFAKLIIQPWAYGHTFSLASPRLRAPRPRQQPSWLPSSPW